MTFIIWGVSTVMTVKAGLTAPVSRMDALADPAFFGVTRVGEVRMKNQHVSAGPVQRLIRGVVLLAALSFLSAPADVAMADSGREKAEGKESVASAALSVSPTSLTMAARSSSVAQVSNASGSVRVKSSDYSVVGASYSAGTIRLSGVKPGEARVRVSDSRNTRTIDVIVTRTAVGSTPSAAGFKVLAWNDLGMHCVDGKDYSVFSILPPYNNLYAQVVNTATGKLVSTGVSLSYESVADATGSINTSSVTKTNFWEYVSALFGQNPHPDIGLAGNPTPSSRPAKMTYSTPLGWFAAEGIPITPYDDKGLKNFYPMVKVVAKDAAGKVLASTSTVLPVSDEMTCKACHASTSVGGSAAQLAAKPPSGWAFDRDEEKDWKWNILRLHDDHKLKSAMFKEALATLGMDPDGLTVTARSGQPVLCAACHASNALPGTGLAGISALTSALHTQHAAVSDPVLGKKLDAIDNRSACYMCHPGSVTKCLRGAMGNVVDANGNASMGCQSCHGTMTAVGAPTRVGWLEQPNCQACHHDGKRELSALDANGKLRKVADTRFATTPDTPPTYLANVRFSLFRFSAGHGKLQCEACHGSTHAEYPSSHDNDNVQSIALQGYAGTIRECSTCHTKVPMTSNGGPHGMHSTNAAWVETHKDAVEKGGKAACAACHGADFRGAPLAEIKVAKSFRVDDRTHSYAPGDKVSCYDCHNGPKGD
jgi:hypothetical protein